MNPKSQSYKKTENIPCDAIEEIDTSCSDKSQCESIDQDIKSKACSSSLFLTELPRNSSIPSTNGIPENTSYNTEKVGSPLRYPEKDFVISKKESKELETLFDKLVECDGLGFSDFQELLKGSSEEINIPP